MKKKQFQRFATAHLVPYLEGFRADGNLLYQIPVGNILRAILFDSSSFSAEVCYPGFFVQPLYIPSEHLILNIGERLRGNWEFKDGAEETLAQKLLDQIHRVAMPFLRRYAHPEDIVHEILQQVRTHEVSYYSQQTLAYSLLILGRNDEGLDELDKLLAMITGDDRPWARGLHADIGRLRETLMRSPEETRALLGQWVEQTRINLGLSE